MLPKYHALFGFIFSIAIFLLLPGIGFLGALVIFLSSFLIDFDHYLYFIFRKKDADPFHAYKWFRKQGERLLSLPKEKRRDYFIAFYVFHGLEWIIILIILGHFLSIYFFFIAVGMLFHLILDWASALPQYGRTMKFSVIVDFLDEKNLKQI